jgi:hypothetical protein
MSPRNPSGTITTTEVRDLLRTAAEKLSSREEKALRMSHGASLDPATVLPRRGQEHPEARAELAALEIDLLRRISAHSGAPAEVEAAAKAGPAPSQSKQKEKIIRALRRLK